jgi:hypothetical protein
MSTLHKTGVYYWSRYELDEIGNNLYTCNASHLAN